MATLTDYKGLDIVEGATGDGGIALTDNFKELADRAPYQAAANPSSSDDTTKGFAAGDQWLNTSTSVLWACVSASTGAAVWKSLYKRTATGLELIPAESSESVHVLGSLISTGSVTSMTGLALTNAATNGMVIFNTSDQTINYESFTCKFISNVLNIGTLSGGTGTSQTLVLGIGLPNSSSINNRYICVQSGIASSTFGAIHLNGGSFSGSTGPLITIGTNAIGTSGQQLCCGIVLAINQSATAGYTALLVNPTETTTGSGAKLLADFQLGGTSKARLDSGGNFVNTGYMRIGSTSTPNNTTPGDLTATRLCIGNSAFQTDNFIRASGTSASTAAGTVTGSLITFTATPGSNSAALFQAGRMSLQVDTSIDLTGGANTGVQGETRVINCGNITGISGGRFTGLLLAAAAVSLESITQVNGLQAVPVSSANNSLTTTITRAVGLAIDDCVNTGSGPLVITGQAGIRVQPLSAATNNTAVLFGTTTIPSGNFAIYSASNDPSLLSGNLQFTNGTGLVAGSSTGFSIGTSTSQKLGFWNTTPVAQQVLATGASKTVDDVITLLQTLGLCRQS